MNHEKADCWVGNIVEVWLLLIQSLPFPLIGDLQGFSWLVVVSQSLLNSMIWTYTPEIQQVARPWNLDDRIFLD